MTDSLVLSKTRTERPVELESPFVGLRPFTWDEADLFFGRDREIRIILANLRAARLTLLYGPSGVGKSSILRAGVAKELRERGQRNLVERGRPEVAVVVFSSWRDDPVAGIEQALERELEDLVPLEHRPRGRALSELLSEWSDVVDGQILVILDQFEEFFLYHGDTTSEGTFAAELADALSRPELGANFLISIREDVYTKLDRFEEDIPQLFENFIRLDHLDREGARAAIYGPLEEYGRRTGEAIRIEDDLVEAALDQVRPRRLTFTYSAAAGAIDEEDGDRIAAPFLQLVLERLWHEERGQGSNVLRRSTLRRLGETKGIVEGHVRRGLAALSEEEQDVAAQAFRFLVTSSGAKVAHSAADLAEFTGLREERVEPVLEKLAGAETRILTRLPAPRPGGSSSYELYHDLLGDAVLAWRSDRLGALEKRAAEAEARAARRRANAFRSIAAGMVVVATISLVLLFVALHARRTADNARKVARSQELVAESEATLPTDPNDALRKAEQALEVKPSSQAEFALRTAFGASELRVAIRHSRGAISRAVYGDHGRRVMALGTDRTVSVSDARTGRLISRIGYRRDLLTADLSPGGRIVVTAGKDKTVRFWDASSGARLARFHNPALSGAWLDPANPRRAVAVGSDGGLRIWRLGDRKPLVLRRSGPSLTEAAFSPNGRMVAAIGLSRDAWLFDARTGTLLHPLVGHSNTVVALAWSRDSTRLITGGNDDWWRIWDVATGTASHGNQVSGPVTAVAFRPDGDAVATATGAQANVWDVGTAVPLAQLEGHSGTVTGVDFSPDGRLLVTSSADGTARVWNLATKTTLTQLRGNAGSVSSAVFSPDGRFVLTASDDRAARIWDVGRGVALWAHVGAVTDATFALGGKRVVTGGVDQRVMISNPRTGAVLRQLPPPQDGTVHGISFSPDGTLLAVATDDPGLIVRRASTGLPITRLKDNRAGVVQAVFDPKGTKLAVADAEGSAGIFDPRTGKPLRWLHEQGQQRAHPLGRVNGIAWSPDGRFLVTVGSDSQVRVWDARSGRYRWTFSRHVGSVESVAFAPRGDRIVTTGVDRTAIVWDIPSRTTVAVLQGDPQPLESAAFSPDGKWVVTGDSGGVVRVWDVRAHKMLAAIPAHAGPVNAVSFSPDGKRILSASDDWSAKIYRCTSCIPLQDLRYRVFKREKAIAP